MTHAPIILFVYNRPEHTRHTLDALAMNEGAKESDLYIYCDGAKTDASEHQLQKISTVRSIAGSESRFKQVIVVARNTNMGLANSVISGVTEVLDKYGKAIILEDDLVSDRYFLSYMNQALDMYTHNEDVACISGYIYPVKKELPDSFFLKGADCWGWGTWKRAWTLFEKNGSKLLQELETRQLLHDFEFYGTYPYIQMLKDQIAGKNNSWAILWYASAYLKNRFTLYPGKSLIHNIGIDGSGTHSGKSEQFAVEIRNSPVMLAKIPIEENLSAKKIVSHYFASVFGTSKPSLFKRIFRKIRTKLN